MVAAHVVPDFLELALGLHDAVAALDLEDVVRAVLDAHQVNLPHEAPAPGVDGHVEQDLVILGFDDAGKEKDVTLVLAEFFRLDAGHLAEPSYTSSMDLGILIFKDLSFLLAISAQKEPAIHSSSTNSVLSCFREVREMVLAKPYFLMATFTHW